MTILLLHILLSIFQVSNDLPRYTGNYKDTIADTTLPGIPAHMLKASRDFNHRYPGAIQYAVKYTPRQGDQWSAVMVELPTGSLFSVAMVNPLHAGNICVRIVNNGKRYGPWCRNSPEAILSGFLRKRKPGTLLMEYKIEGPAEGEFILAVLPRD